MTFWSQTRKSAPKGLGKHYLQSISAPPFQNTQHLIKPMQAWFSKMQKCVSKYRICIMKTFEDICESKSKHKFIGIPSFSLALLARLRFVKIDTDFSIGFFSAILKIICMDIFCSVSNINVHKSSTSVVWMLSTVRLCFVTGQCIRPKSSGSDVVA